jgi:hypothetical protein
MLLYLLFGSQVMGEEFLMIQWCCRGYILSSCMKARFEAAGGHYNRLSAVYGTLEAWSAF